MNEIKLSIIIPVYNQHDLVLRAIKSIPERCDIEIIVVDDGSTDGTIQCVREYQYYSKRNIITMRNADNMGVGYTVNRGLEIATGEYIVLLGSDDYFIDLNIAMAHLNGADLIYFDLEINDGTIFHLSDKTKYGYCGSVKFMRREFIGDLREPEIRSGEDYYFYLELMKKNPTEIFLNRVHKHYNFPRKNSLFDLKKKGLL